jgi:sigma-B regulation protein RsbU (phosphoserine phosphatase)
MVLPHSHERVGSGAVPSEALRALVDAVQMANFGSTRDALDAFAAVTVEICSADAAVVLLAEPEGTGLTAHAVHATSPSLAAELAGSRVEAGEETRSSRLDFAFSAPIALDGERAGSLDVLRDSAPFSEGERLLAQLAAGELALVLRALEARPAETESAVERALVLAGEAFAAGSDHERGPEHIARLAADAAGAQAAVLWQAEAGELKPAASFGDSPAAESAALSAARVALESRSFFTREQIGGAAVVSVRLGEPAVVLQLVFADDPDDNVLAGLTTFALRAAQTLRAGAAAREAARELGRTRALLAVVAQATARLSLEHALTTAIEHVTVLVGADRVAVYLRDGKRLHAAASRNLAGPHSVVAERLLELALGRYRGRGMVVIADFERDESLAAVSDAAGEAGIRTALALPLVVRGETIGLLAAYPEDGRDVNGEDEAMLGALAAQLAIAVQNARLHEQAKLLAVELDSSLDAEREAARRVRALYDVSESFAQSLSLNTTLDALARSAVELLGVDAAVIRMPDARRELLEQRAVHVADPRLGEAAIPALTRPQTLDVVPMRRLFRTRRPLMLTPQLAGELGGSHRLLAPFLEKGSSVAVVPIATPGEVIGTLTIVSFDPGRPIVGETLDTALSLTAQAALAIDNGRLYQQQKEFADTMRRSLLPRSHPQLQGLDIGEVYQPSTRVDVGGDVYDFLDLGDGRLAVVLGDVTGHGIEATADMAMAKFVFRSLAREHPDPGDFLASANEVVVGEIAAGKFITMLYLTVESATGAVVAASAGHPPPLLVSREGDVQQLNVRGLALGVDSGQTYEEHEARLDRGGAIVIYTDGVVEARRDGELYGFERLARIVAASLDRPAAEIASTVIDECRSFAGDLADDCALVVIKR